MNVEKLREELIRDEGFELMPYRCSSGKLTIGVGRNLTDCGISPAEARFMFANDLHRAIKIAETVVGVVVFQGLTEARQRVLVNMAYNLGPAGLRGFTRMLAAIWRADYEEVATQMMDSVWAKQVGSRAERLAEMMRQG